MFGTAPHKKQTKQQTLKDVPIINRARKGDYYQLAHRVGGGGGHKLELELFRIIVKSHDKGEDSSSSSSSDKSKKSSGKSSSSSKSDKSYKQDDSD